MVGFVLRFVPAAVRSFVRHDDRVAHSDHTGIEHKRILSEETVQSVVPVSHLVSTLQFVSLDSGTLRRNGEIRDNILPLFRIQYDTFARVFGHDATDSHDSFSFLGVCRPHVVYLHADWSLPFHADIVLLDGTK